MSAEIQSNAPVSVQINEANERKTFALWYYREYGKSISSFCKFGHSDWTKTEQKLFKVWTARAALSAPVAAQPDVTQQTLDDVKAGIPARDAEIDALRKEIEVLRACAVPAETLRVCGVIADKIEDGSLFMAGIYRNKDLAGFIRQVLNSVSIAKQSYPLNLDPAGIRALTADAISGALVLGYQGVNPPPDSDHWLAPFWEIGRESAAQAQQPVSGADALLVEEQLCYSGHNPSKNIGTRILPEATLAKLTEPHDGKQHQESQDCPSHQNIKDQLRHHASPVTAQVDAIIVQNIDGGAELSGKLRTLLSEGQIFAAVQCLTAEVREDNGLIVLSNVNSCIRTLEQAVLKKVAAQHTATLASIEAFVACDASAISYLTLGQYRTALLKMLREGAQT